MSLQDHARSVLLQPALADKLRPPRGSDGSLLVDHPGAPIVIEAPARDGRLAFSDETARLPKLGDLVHADARRTCLMRFAHHELMAVELFAWAILAFPQAPPALRRGFARALEEEQQHLELYRARLRDDHGADLGDDPVNGYFWHVLPTGDDATLLSFLVGQGLTLEQANLDFTILYRDAFRRSGDEATAAVLQRVHDEEIGHVKLAYTWFMRLKGDRPDVLAYDDEVRFPLSAARAKGRRFERGARERAGLSKEFIAHIESARPYESRTS